MGANSSTLENPNPQNPPPSTSTMSPISPNSQNPDPKTLENQNPDPKTLDNQIPEFSDIPTIPDEKGQNQNQNQDQNLQNEEEINGEKEKGKEGEGEEEEEGECGFCLFMKGGGCKDQFISWENCVEEAEKNKEDIVEKCAEITGNLKKCMEDHAEYYEPILRAEKVADEEVKKELEREEAKKNENSEGNDESKVVEETVDIEVEKLASEKA